MKWHLGQAMNPCRDVTHVLAHLLPMSPVYTAFKEDNKWRLSDGSATINAIFSDAEFLSAVDQNLESFSKGDVLICDVRVRQWQTASGAKTDYEVIKVIEHRRAARQIPLPGIPSTPPPRRSS
jgi:hypothetical protein